MIKKIPKPAILEESSLSQVEFSLAVEISEQEISLVKEEDAGDEADGAGDQEIEDRQGIHSIADLTPIKL